MRIRRQRRKSFGDFLRKSIPPEARARHVAVVKLIKKLKLKTGRFHGPRYCKNPVAGLRRKGYALTEGVEDIPTNEGAPSPSIPTADPEQLWKVLRDQFGAACLRPAADFDDDVYYLPTLAQAKEVFSDRGWLLSEIQPWLQAFDCEDYAYAQKAVFSAHQHRDARGQRLYAGMAAGIIWGTLDQNLRHALNFVVTSDQGVRLFDASSGVDCEPGRVRLSVQYLVV